MEIIIALVIAAFAVFIIFKNLKKSSKGECNCGTCSSSCPKYNELKLGKKK